MERADGYHGTLVENYVILVLSWTRTEQYTPYISKTTTIMLILIYYTNNTILCSELYWEGKEVVPSFSGEII